MSLYEPELTLQDGVIAPINGVLIASCIRDGSPDAWGRRVILNRLTGKQPDAAGVPEISQLTFLRQSGPDRIDALVFQASAAEYVRTLPRKPHSTNSSKRLSLHKRSSLLLWRSTRPSITTPRSVVRASRR